MDKEFLNKQFHILWGEGIKFQVCKYHDVKFAVVERAHWTIRDRLHKYISYKNTYRFCGVFPKFVKAYNDTVHSKPGIAL